MKTLAALVFIAVVAAFAIALAGKPTVATGAVMEGEIMSIIKSQGVAGVRCPARIPIGRNGAEFQCTAVLGGGMEQQIACALDREGKLVVEPAGAPVPAGRAAEDGARRAISPPGDPWAN